MFAYVFLYQTALKLANRLPKKLEHNHERINSFNCRLVPITTMSTFMSMMYCASESFACLIEMDKKVSGRAERSGFVGGGLPPSTTKVTHIH